MAFSGPLYSYGISSEILTVEFGELYHASSSTRAYGLAALSLFVEEYAVPSKGTSLAVLAPH